MTADAAAAELMVTRAPRPRVTVPGEQTVDVSVVIVTYGTGPIVIDAIEAIVATTGGHRIEVIVVDNPHPRRAGRTARELLLATDGVRLLRPPSNLGFGGGCNAGARRARGDVLALVNPDAVPRPGWLEPLLAALADGATIAAPVLLDPNGLVEECGQVLYADATTRAVRTRPSSAAVIRADYASAACWVMRSADFHRLGGFDPRFHPAYFEDVDLALRVRSDGGACVVCAASEVIHRSGQGTPEAPTPAFAQRELLVSKWPELVSTQPNPPSG